MLEYLILYRVFCFIFKNDLLSPFWKSFGKERKKKRKKKPQPLAQRRATPLPPRLGPRAAQERARTSLPSLFSFAGS